jgi:hypothetical protein
MHKTPAIKQPIVAIFADLAAMQRAWKSSAPMFPNDSTMSVAQLKTMALGNGAIE